MARQLRINYQNLQNLEDGEIDRPRYLPELAKYMRTTVEDLVSGKMPPPLQAENRQAQSMSHPLLQDASVATENRGGKQPVSFDAEFKKMSPTEQRRFVFLWAASFDSPPEIGESLGGIPWIDQNEAPASSQATIGAKGRHKPRTTAKPGTKRKLK